MILPGVVVGLTAIVFRHGPVGGLMGLALVVFSAVIQWLSQPAPKAAPVRGEGSNIPAP